MSLFTNHVCSAFARVLPPCALWQASYLTVFFSMDLYIFFSKSQPLLFLISLMFLDRFIPILLFTIFFIFDFFLFNRAQSFCMTFVAVRMNLEKLMLPMNSLMLLNDFAELSFDIISALVHLFPPDFDSFTSIYLIPNIVTFEDSRTDFLFKFLRSFSSLSRQLEKHPEKQSMFSSFFYCSIQCLFTLRRKFSYTIRPREGSILADCT